MATHAFVPSGRYKVSAVGRKLEYCEECDRLRIGKTHPSLGRRIDWDKGKPVAPTPELVPEPEFTPQPEPWQFGMLKDAARHVLEDLSPDTIGWRLRFRIMDVLKAFELDSVDPPLMRDPVVDEPPPLPRSRPAPVVIRSSQRHVNRKLIRSLRDNWLGLAERALDEGWTVEKAGGHLKFKGPNTEFVTIPASPGEGRGYQNARATFKRLGLNVEGL